MTGRLRFPGELRGRTDHLWCLNVIEAIRRWPWQGRRVPRRTVDHYHTYTFRWLNVEVRLGYLERGESMGVFSWRKLPLSPLLPTQHALKIYLAASKTKQCRGPISWHGGLVMRRLYWEPMKTRPGQRALNKHLSTESDKLEVNKAVCWVLKLPESSELLCFDFFVSKMEMKC